jgi:hypothetical protein
MDDDFSDAVGDTLSSVLGDYPTEHEPTMQSGITPMRNMTEEQREMLNNAIQPNTQLWVQKSELMDANREYCRESI